MGTTQLVSQCRRLEYALCVAVRLIKTSKSAYGEGNNVEYATAFFLRVLAFQVVELAGVERHILLRYVEIANVEIREIELG